MMRGKKAVAIESYIKHRIFTGAEYQPILKIIWDYDICAHKQCLDEQMKAVCFVNALREQAREFFCENSIERTTFVEMIHLVRIKYTSKAH